MAVLQSQEKSYTWVSFEVHTVHEDRDGDGSWWAVTNSYVVQPSSNQIPELTTMQWAWNCEEENSIFNLRWAKFNKIQEDMLRLHTAGVLQQIKTILFLKWKLFKTILSILIYTICSESMKMLIYPFCKQERKWLNGNNDQWDSIQPFTITIQ